MLRAVAEGAGRRKHRTTSSAQSQPISSRSRKLKPSSQTTGPTASLKNAKASEVAAPQDTTSFRANAALAPQLPASSLPTRVHRYSSQFPHTTEQSSIVPTREAWVDDVALQGLPELASLQYDDAAVRHDNPRVAVKLFQNRIECFSRYFDPISLFLDNNKEYFRGELTDISV